MTAIVLVIRPLHHSGLTLLVILDLIQNTSSTRLHACGTNAGRDAYVRVALTQAGTPTLL